MHFCTFSSSETEAHEAIVHVKQMQRVEAQLQLKAGGVLAQDLGFRKTLRNEDEFLQLADLRNLYNSVQ